MLEAIFVKPFANLLFVLYNFLPGHDFGVAVIILTAAIRFALWPILAKQLHSQKKLQALQPDIARIKVESDGDKQKESAMLMELYKEKEINPLASCLPLLIQFPFLIGLFAVFSRSTSGVSGFEPMLYNQVKNLGFISEVIKQPGLFKPFLFGVIDLAIKHNIFLAVLAGASQFIQVKQITPQNVDSTDPSASANKAMMWMFPILTGWIGYTVVAALPLYWTVSNLISILQQTVTGRNEVDKMEEATVVTKVRSVGASDKTPKTLSAAKPKTQKGTKRGKKK
ncbi:MAG: YidC/Oxa1 family membrane protein insertase [bacterium]